MKSLNSLVPVMSNAHLLEIILGVSQKVMSNYVNHLAQTPVDAAFNKFE